MIFQCFLLCQCKIEEICLVATDIRKKHCIWICIPFKMTSTFVHVHYNWKWLLVKYPPIYLGRIINEVIKLSVCCRIIFFKKKVMEGNEWKIQIFCAYLFLCSLLSCLSFLPHIIPSVHSAVVRSDKSIILWNRKKKAAKHRTAIKSAHETHISVILQLSRGYVT